MSAARIRGPVSGTTCDGKNNEDVLVVTFPRHHHFHLGQSTFFFTRISSCRLFLTTTTNSEWMCFGIEHPLIQVDDTGISKGQIHVLQHLGEVETWQLWLKKCCRLIHVHDTSVNNILSWIRRCKEALEDLPVPVGIVLLASYAVRIPKALNALWV